VAVIDDAAQMIRARLDELDEETARLKRALVELDANSTARRSRSPGSDRAKAARIPRAKREQAIIAFVKSHPSASAQEIGAGVGTTANYVNNILSGLRKEGRLVRKADGAQVELKAGSSRPPSAKSATPKKPAAKSATRKKPGRIKRSGKSQAGKKKSSRRGPKSGAAKAAVKPAAGK
jgi:hypothetical protein